MFRPRKHIKLDSLNWEPGLNDLQRSLNEAQKNRSITVELPWRLKDANLFYSLAVRAEFGPLEPVWTLYEGEGSRSHVIWSAPFTDLELLKEVVSLTVAESTGRSHSSLPAQVDSSLVVENQWQEAEEEIKQRENTSEPEPKEKSPELTPAPSQAPSPYAYFYPSYPYPIPYPYPYPYQQAVPGQQTLAGTVPLQPVQMASAQNQPLPLLSQPNPELFSKQKNFMLGQFLIDTGLMVPETLNTILKLQGMITNGLIDTEQVVEAVKKAHGQSSAIEVAGLIKKLSAQSNVEQRTTIRQVAPLLGEILVKAEVISNALLLAVLKLQEVVRSGAMTQGEACQALKKELAGGKAAKRQSQDITSGQQESAASLLVKAGLISADDKETAYRVQKKHGGKIDNILAAAGKTSKKTFAAAIECEYLLSQNKIKLEQVMIALNYCERSRVGLAEAITDLGWRDDLDL